MFYLNFPLSSMLRNYLEPILYSQGRTLKSYHRKLEKTQFFKEEQLLDLQWARFKSIINYAYENNAFYENRFNEAKISPKQIKSPDDISLIPVLTKEDVRINTKEMISREFSVDKLQRYKTGGSTGKPLEIYSTEECSALRNAYTRRNDCWSGWKHGEPVAAIWGNPHYPLNFKEKFKHWLLTPYIFLDTMKVSEESIKRFVLEWRIHKPTLIFGHAHSIYLLAQYLRELDIKEIHPKGIISTSMMLLPHERILIENTFHEKVTDRYGCEEVSLIASECEKHEGLHLNIEHLYIELLNESGKPAAPGEPGKIIITDLLNRAMPFIRYQVEDVGVLSDKRCTCGRGLPLMSSVSGRVADFLIKRDGTQIAGVSLIENTLTKIPEINQMQIIQESYDRILINIVPGSYFSNSSKTELIDYFLDLFDAAVEIKINCVDKIPPEKSGKYRFSICKINN